MFMPPKYKIRNLEKAACHRDIGHDKAHVLQVRVDWGSHIRESKLAYLAEAMLCPPTTQRFHSWICILEKVPDRPAEGICELVLMSVIYGGRLGGKLGVLL